MTSILVRTLADTPFGARVLDATITATATRAREDGADIVLPETVVVRLRNGELSTPLELEAPDGTWAWRFTIRPTDARPLDALVLLRTWLPAPEIEWADMTPVDPATLLPLDPFPPSAGELLVRAEAAVGEAEDAVDEATAALGVANTAVVSGAVAGDDLILTRKNGGTINAGNVRGFPGSPIPYGALLGDVSLDTIIASGVYFQETPANITPANAYPTPGGNSGMLEVLALNAANVVQRYTPRSGLNAGQGFYQRRRAGTWGAWTWVSGGRVDKTAGIAIYTNDNVSAREQLIYGDTGLRTISADMGVTSGNVYIRRRGYEVTVSFVNAVLPAINVYIELPALPAGWRPVVNSNGVVIVSAAPQRLVVISTGVMRIYGQSAAPVTVDGTITFTTNQGWPTTLPGTANGGIPNV